MKRVPFILVILLITVGAIQNAKAIDPTIRKHFPITAAILAPSESEWHAGIVPLYFEYFSNPLNKHTFKPTYAAYIRGDKRVYHYFSYAEAQRELIIKRIQLFWGPKTDEEIARIIETAEIRKIPDGIENEFAFLRLKKGRWQSVPRTRYWEGRKLEDGRVIKFDELGLYQGDFLIVSLSCVNLADPLKPFGEPDGPYKPEKRDTVWGFKETILKEIIAEKPIYKDTSGVTQTNTQVVKIEIEDKRQSGTTTEQQNHHHCDGSCKVTKKDGKEWHDGALGKFAIATGGTILGNWIWDKINPNRRVIVNNGGGVYSNGGWQTPPIVYGNTGQGQGGSNDTPIITGGGTTTTGGYPNTWFQNVSGLWQNRVTGQTLVAGETPENLIPATRTGTTTRTTTTTSTAQPVTTAAGAISL